jgi:hypothetical protein
LGELHRCVGDTLNKLPKSQPSRIQFGSPRGSELGHAEKSAADLPAGKHPLVKKFAFACLRPT